jgi:hypothetical protein
MMSTIDSKRGAAAVMMAHVAGMIDLVALPIWVGALVGHYGYSLEQAGFTVTCFLIGVVTASLLLASGFNKARPRLVAPAGYGVAAIALLAASTIRDPALLLMLHILGGAGVGCGLSVTHGLIGRSTNPHRLFAWSGMALGVFALLFYAAVPRLVVAHGGQILFVVMGAMMLLAALAACTFPAALAPTETRVAKTALSATTWAAIAGVACLTLNQAMIYSFLERIGVTRGFGIDRVNLVLAAVGFINLFPAVLAALLQHKLPAQRVAIGAALLQMGLGLTITLSGTFWPFAGAASVCAFVLIFSHTFIFGLLARLDTSGRAVSLTPAMLMAGSALGPGIAGVVAQRIGFNGLAVAIALVGTVATICFIRVSRNSAFKASFAGSSSAA